MKYLPILLSLLTGCAAKKPPAKAIQRESIPPRCIMGGFVDKTTCEPYEKDPSLAICQNVIVKYACVQVDQK
jgi:hypothetical protein